MMYGSRPGTSRQERKVHIFCDNANLDRFPRASSAASAQDLSGIGRSLSEIGRLREPTANSERLSRGSARLQDYPEDTQPVPDIRKKYLQMLRFRSGSEAPVADHLR